MYLLTFPFNKYVRVQPTRRLLHGTYKTYPFFGEVRVAQYLVFYVVFCRSVWFFLYLYSHCIVCTSIYVFWYLQTILCSTSSLLVLALTHTHTY